MNLITKINLILKIFIASSIFSQDLKKEIYFLEKAIEAFNNNKIQITQNYLVQSLQTNTEIQNTKEYLKLQLYMNFINNNSYYANQYFRLLEESNYLDNFLVYFKIIMLINDRQYEKIQNYLNKILLKDFYKQNEFSILPFDCIDKDNLSIEKQLKINKNKILWRENITQKEFAFLEFLKQIIIFKNHEQIPILEQCIESNQSSLIVYHLYRLLLMIQPIKENYFQFYEFLYNNGQFIEALHVLRTLNTLVDYSYENPNFYFLLLNFKNVYKKLNYQENVDTIKRFLKVLVEEDLKKTISFVELKKIATENYNCREFLLFLIKFSKEEEKQFYYDKLKEYDLKFDMKEKISYYKKIYKY
ncbi:MAG: hypothetical protein ACK4UJ_03365 [Leptonema sp. (in: bacteria)]